MEFRNDKSLLFHERAVLDGNKPPPTNAGMFWAGEGKGDRERPGSLGRVRTMHPGACQGSEDPQDLIEMGSSVCSLKNRDLLETLLEKRGAVVLLVSARCFCAERVPKGSARCSSETLPLAELPRFCTAAASSEGALQSSCFHTKALRGSWHIITPSEETSIRCLLGAEGAGRNVGQAPWECSTPGVILRQKIAS